MSDQTEREPRTSKSESKNEFFHRSVLSAEVLDALLPAPGGCYVDLTAGAGGHSAQILNACAPDGTLVAVDRDQNALVAARQNLSSFGKRVTFVHSAFSEFSAFGAEPRFDGALADIGVSSPQLDHKERGFSFRDDGPLDMRMDQSSGQTAKEFIAGLDAEELANVIYQYGEERRSRPIARSIKDAEAAGRLETTSDLANAVRRVFRGRGKIDPATRTFQAIRIAVNDELGELERLLETAPLFIKEGGTLAIITFHSLEDRLVKWTFRRSESYAPTTKRPVQASDEERQHNPRARSAKLRAATIISNERAQVEVSS